MHQFTDQYGRPAPSISRYRIDVTVRVVAARTGRIVAQQNFFRIPRPVNASEPYALTVLEVPVTFEDTQNWLRQFVSPGSQVAAYTPSSLPTEGTGQPQEAPEFQPAASAPAMPMVEPLAVPTFQPLPVVVYRPPVRVPPVFHSPVRMSPVYHPPARVWPVYHPPVPSFPVFRPMISYPRPPMYMPYRPTRYHGRR